MKMVRRLTFPSLTSRFRQTDHRRPSRSRSIIPTVVNTHPYINGETSPKSSQPAALFSSISTSVARPSVLVSPNSHAEFSPSKRYLCSSQLRLFAVIVQQVKRDSYPPLTEPRTHTAGMRLSAMASRDTARSRIKPAPSSLGVLTTRRLVCAHKFDPSRALYIPKRDIHGLEPWKKEKGPLWKKTSIARDEVLAARDCIEQQRSKHEMRKAA